MIPSSGRGLGEETGEARGETEEGEEAEEEAMMELAPPLSLPLPLEEGCVQGDRGAGSGFGAGGALSMSCESRPATGQEEYFSTALSRRAGEVEVEVEGGALWLPLL